MNFLKSNYEEISDSDYEFEQENSSIPLIPDEILYKYQKHPMSNYLTRQAGKCLHAFVFIEIWPNPYQRAIFDRVVGRANECLKKEGICFTPLYKGRMNAIKPLHVSLSGSINFHDSSTASKWLKILKERISKDCTLRPTNIRLKSLSTLYPNFDNSVLFLSMPLAETSQTFIASLINHVELTILKFKQHLEQSTQPQILGKAHISLAKDINAPTFSKSLINNNYNCFDFNAASLKKTLCDANTNFLSPKEIEQLQFGCGSIKIHLDTSVVHVSLSENEK